MLLKFHQRLALESATFVFPCALPDTAVLQLGSNNRTAIANDYADERHNDVN
jgi:hypothetical protein